MVINVNTKIENVVSLKNDLAYSKILKRPILLTCCKQSDDDDADDLYPLKTF